VIKTEPETVEPTVGDSSVTAAMGVGVGEGAGVGVLVGDGVGVEVGVGVGAPLITFIVIVEDAISTLLLLYAFIESLCSPLATVAEFQGCVYGGEEAIQPLST
jgi:hypothetical protein